jgi:allantoinase
MLKLPAHSRYAYFADRRAERLQLAGRQAARLYVALNIEHLAFGAGLGMAPMRSGQQTTRNLAWRNYGNRIGNQSDRDFG